MKSITGHLAGSATLLMFPLLFLWQKKRKYLLLLVFPAIVISSCYQHYFRTKTQQTLNQDLLQNLQSMNKYFIIHFKDGAYALNNMSVQNNIINAEKTSIPDKHGLFMNPDTAKTNRLKKTDKKNVLMEVHLYTDNLKTEDNHLSLPMSDIKRADIYTLDKKATTTNHVVSTIGIVILSLPVISFIIFAIACNCPQVYVENNGGYHFNGGLYSGAVYASLERTDYMPIDRLNVENYRLNIKINNAPDEEQFINKIYLIMADHKSGSEILADRHGKLFSFNNPVKPVSAINNNHIGVKKILEQKDGISYSFNDESKEQFSSVLLTFKKNQQAKNARLIIRGKNSLWSGYIYKNFNSLFGESLDAWKKKQDKAEPKVMEDWQKDQALPLMVYKKKGGQWIAVDYFSTPGNTAERDMIMNIDLSTFDNEKIELKLETSFLFWDLDYAAMDFSENNIIKTQMIDPLIAKKSLTINEKQSVLANDQQYCRLTGNESIELQFDVADKKIELSQSYFLACSGYYHSLQKYSGKPNTALLMQFKKKGTFSAYSREKYTELNDELNKTIVAK